MIREYTNREVARIMGEETAPVVEFVPCLIISRRGVSLECRIRGKRQYLIKDLGALPTRSEREKSRIRKGLCI